MRQPDLTEQELLSDLLNQEKQLMLSYATHIQEASCTNLRKLLTSQFNQTSQDQFAVFDQMRQKGYYQTSDASGKDVQRIKNAFKNVQHELDTKPPL